MRAVARRRGGIWIGTVGELAKELGSDAPRFVGRVGRRLPSDVIDERETVKAWFDSFRRSARRFDLVLDVFDSGIRLGEGPMEPGSWAAWLVDRASIRSDHGSFGAKFIEAVRTLVPLREWWRGTPAEWLYAIACDLGPLPSKSANTLGDLAPCLWAANAVFEADGSTLWTFNAVEDASRVFVHSSLSNRGLVRGRRHQEPYGEGQKLCGGFYSGFVVFPVRDAESGELRLAGAEVPDAFDVAEWAAEDARRGRGGRFSVRDGRTLEAFRAYSDNPRELHAWLEKALAPYVDRRAE